VHDFPETPLGALRRLQALLPQSMRSGRRYGQLESHRACSRGIARIKGRRSPSGTALPGTNAEPESPDAFLLAG